MALAGRDTSGIGTYTDDLTREPELVRLRDLADVSFKDGFGEAQSEVTVVTADGRRLEAMHDAGQADRDLARQGRKLADKFDALVEPVLGKRARDLRDALAGFGGSATIADIMKQAGSVQ
jgi:hypothetical protein